MTDLGGRPPLQRALALLNSAQEIIYLARRRPGNRLGWRHGKTGTASTQRVSRLFSAQREKPTEVLLVGSIGLPLPVARQILAVFAGWFPSAVEKLARGGRPQGRPVLHIEKWPSCQGVAQPDRGGP